MNLADSHPKRLESISLTPDEHALRCCRTASEFIDIGQYETAREALGDLWRGVGQRPELEGLAPSVTAEVLLQCGTLTGWLGSAQHISGAQEKAKDLLSEALRTFDSERRRSKVSEAQYELGMSYWRLGAFDEARVVLDEALRGLGEHDTELKAKILIRHTLTELWTGRYHDAWNILKEAESIFESCNDALKGRWHGQKAIILTKMAITERRSDYADRAIIEYTAAICHYEEAKHERYCATNLNNLAFLLHKVARYAEAHEHLDRAQEIFERHRDGGNLAQVKETRARVLVEEGRYEEANRVIAGVIETFEKGGEHALLADALTIQGVVWARLAMHESSVEVFRHAVGVAEDSGSFSNAGLAALALIEEHGLERLSEAEVCDVYRRADELLRDTQDGEEIARLRACARIMARRLMGVGLSDEGFALTDALMAYEARFIREALEVERGVISRAARRLGIRHQSLTHTLNTRHRDLLNLRTPAMSRRRSIIHKGFTSKTRAVARGVRPVTILHVEDHEIVAATVKDTLEMEGWRVATCDDGAEALRELAGGARYDLLIVDNDLPGVSGLELVRRARSLSHRRRTPIMMLSASEVEREAWRAGVNAFLRKPQDIEGLTAMVTRLLSKSL